MKIIVVHRGNPVYLKYVLAQVAVTNTHSEVVLLGDKSNRNLSFVTHYFIDHYFSEARHFGSVYRHMNDSAYDYWLFCYQRWFCVYELMREESIARAVIIDSDVLVYYDLDKIEGCLQGRTAFGIAENPDDNPGLWIAGPPIAFFSLDSLRRILDYFLESYQNPSILSLLESKMAFHKERNETYGICDMAQFYLYAKSTPEIVNLFEPFSVDNELCRMDESILDTNAFIPDGVCKKLEISGDGKIYAFERATGRRLRFPILHFQGYYPINAKKWIPRYYRGSRFRLARALETFTTPLLEKYKVRERVKHLRKFGVNVLKRLIAKQ